ncbi:MAG: hypothetical protein WB650_23900 [Candidatus Binatus sp.]
MLAIDVERSNRLSLDHQRDDRTHMHSFPDQRFVFEESAGRLEPAETWLTGIENLSNPAAAVGDKPPLADMASFLQCQRYDFELISSGIVNGQARAIDLQKPAENLRDRLEQRLRIEFCCKKIRDIEQQSLDADDGFRGRRRADRLDRFQNVTQIHEFCTPKGLKFLNWIESRSQRRGVSRTRTA